MKCPICNKDRNSPEALGLERELTNEYGIISEMHHPGGRTLKFSNKIINLHDECSWCDYDKVKEELAIYKS